MVYFGIMEVGCVDRMLVVNIFNAGVDCYPFDDRRIPSCRGGEEVVLAFIRRGLYEWMPEARLMIRAIKELSANRQIN